MTQTNINTDDCWLYASYINPVTGYGQRGIKHHGKSKYQYVHRIFYENIKGRIPKGLAIDHLCGVRHCINPIHMEAITNNENVRRGQYRNSWNAKKTHCPKGHEYTISNTMLNKRGGRLCRTCKRLARLH